MDACGSMEAGHGGGQGPGARGQAGSDLVVLLTEDSEIAFCFWDGHSLPVVCCIYKVSASPKLLRFFYSVQLQGTKDLPHEGMVTPRHTGDKSVLASALSSWLGPCLLSFSLMCPNSSHC